MNFRDAKGGRRGSYESKSAASLFAVGIVAFLWGVSTCGAQIQANAYVSSFFLNNVVVVNTETNTVIGSPIPVGTGPFGVAATPDGKFAYVANDGSNTISVINTATNQVTSTSVGNIPFGVAVTPDAKFAYVTNNGSNTVSVIDTTTNQVANTVPVGTGPFGLAVTPDGKSAYVANNGSNNVTVIDTGTKGVVATIAVGAQPQGIAITPDGQFAYVTNLASNTVSVISTTSNTVVASVPVPFAGMDAITPDGRFVYVTNQSDPNGTVTVIDTASNTVVTGAGLPIIVQRAPFGVAVTPDGSFVYVANRFSDHLSVIDPATNSVAATVPVPDPLVFGSFIGPNVIVAPGGPLLISGDAALTALGFGNPGLGFPIFVDFNGGTLETTGSLVTSRTISLLTLGGTIDTNGFNSIFSGNIINSGSLTKIGAGTLTLSGSNTYSGGTNILGGVLSVSSDTNLGTGSISIGNNAELLTTGAIFSSGKSITLVNGGGMLASANGAVATYTGVISGTGPLTIGDGINQGTIFLSAPNTYSGGTTINRGILEIGADNALGLTSGALTFNGGTLQTLASFTSARAITLDAAGGTFEPSAGTTFTESGTITGAGGLTKTGSGVVILAGNSSYAGGTTVLAGTLQAGSAGGFATNTAYTISGGTLDLNNFNLTMSSLNGSGGVVNLGSAALTIQNAGIDVYSGTIQGTGSLTKTGTGTQTLSGNNSYTGGTTLLAGTLQAGSAGGFVSNTAYTVSGGTLDLNNFNLTMSSFNGAGGVVNLGSATLTIQNAGIDVYSGIYSRRRFTDKDRHRHADALGQQQLYRWNDGPGGHIAGGVRRRFCH